MSTTALPPAPASKPNCAFQKELYDRFQMVSFVLYVVFTLQCYALLYVTIFYVSCVNYMVSMVFFDTGMCLNFDIKYLDVYLNIWHLIQDGNCFAKNIRDTPHNYNTAFHVFPV